MLAGFLLVLAILILGGIIAAIGDRIGTKIGKARLSLFNLRPKNTAVLVTIATGVMIAGASTAAMLLVSDRARVALFEYDRLQADLRNAHREKERAEQELRAALAERNAAQGSLDQIERQLSDSRRQIRTVEAQKQELRTEAQLLQSNNARLRGERDRLTARIADSQLKLGKLDTQVKKQRVALFEQVARNFGLVKENNQLRLGYARDLQIFGQEVRALRASEIIYKTGDVLATASVRGSLSPERALEVINDVLSQTEKQVRSGGARPPEGDRTGNALLITTVEVNRLVDELTRPGDHALQLLVAINAVEGEPVQAIGRVQDNRLLFRAGEVIDSIQLDREQLRRTADPLEPFVDIFNRANRRARDAGIFTSANNKVGNFSAVDLQMMLQQLRSSSTDSPITIQAVTKEDIYTVGPLRLTLVAIQNGRVISKAGE